MEQYLNLLKDILDKGTYKPAAREGMPGTQSLFGYQFRHDLNKGFPLLTTKEMRWSSIVSELIWFLKGDTNIKYLVDNNCNIWNEDAYNYYERQIEEANKSGILGGKHVVMSFSDFVAKIKVETAEALKSDSYLPGYTFGDCGFQYGKVWRRWRAPVMNKDGSYGKGKIDQIARVIDSLRKNPESRRHIVTAVDPAHDQDLALYWCHSMFQFNCRPINTGANPYKRYELLLKSVDEDQLKEKYGDTDFGCWIGFKKFKGADANHICDLEGVPTYYLDCQLYQRSADVILGVPFNIASYALLTHIIAHICNMVPGEYIHTFGDVHVYDNHRDALFTQVNRLPGKLPRLLMNKFSLNIKNVKHPVDLFDGFSLGDFTLEDYKPQSKIKAVLSTGLKNNK